MANIVICADGTWSRPEEDLAKDFPTNVLKLARAIQPSGKSRAAGSSEVFHQHVFYDWGLGSYHNALAGGITGAGIHKNILDCYRYLVQNISPKDKIFLFGFSRGAYTVRAVSGLIYNCGIVKRPDARLISEAWRIYKSPSKACHPDGATATMFREQHALSSRAVHFVGVWDTVGALGLPFGVLGLLDAKDEFYDTKMGANVSFARHAMAIDETREDFIPTLWTPRPGVDVKQVWFAGVHSDVGGSYGPDHNGNEAADVSLQWMMEEAQSAGLQVEPHLKQRLSDGANAKLHNSRRHIFRFKRPLDRELAIDGIPTLIHPSVKARYEADAHYRPPKLRQWVEQVGWSGIPVGH